MRIIETIFIAFMATVFAVPVAFVMSFYVLKTLWVVIPRLFHIYNIKIIAQRNQIDRALDLGHCFSVWVGIGPFSGMLALLIHSIASLAKIIPNWLSVLMKVQLRLFKPQVVMLFR